MIKIIFVSQGGYGGSEACLYNIISHMDASRFSCELILTNSPDVPKRISDSFPCNLLPSKKSRKKEIQSKIARNVLKIETDALFIENRIKSFNADLLYINTAVLPEIAETAMKTGIAYVVHFHELISVLDQIKGQRLENMVQNAAMNIACSNSVLRNLEYLGSKSDFLFYEQIDFEHVKISDGNEQNIRAELNLNDYKFTWAMAGASSPRKGFDLFVDMAERKPDSCFIWIGRQRDHGYNRVLERKIEKRQIRNIRLIDEQGQDYYNYLNAADGFFLSSREDPFPLVMIEAAYLEKGIAAFNSGGVSEFLKTGMGRIVESLDLNKMTEVMSEIENGTTEIDGQILYNRAMEFDITRNIESWENNISSLYERLSS